MILYDLLLLQDDVVPRTINSGSEFITETTRASPNASLMLARRLHWTNIA